MCLPIRVPNKKAQIASLTPLSGLSNFRCNAKLLASQFAINLLFQFHKIVEDLRHITIAHARIYRGLKAL